LQEGWDRLQKDSAAALSSPRRGASSKKPIRDERRVTVSVWSSRIGDRSWDFDYSIHGDRRVEYAVGRTTQVAYDYNTRSTVQISGKLRKELMKYVGLPLKFREAD